MAFYENTFARSRFFATVVLCLGFSVVAWGEHIRFSKPVVAIAAPPKPQQEIPDMEDRSFGFSAPSVDRPIIPPMPMVRIQPRKVEKDDDGDSGKSWLARNPTNFPDAIGRMNAQNPLRPENVASALTRDSSGNRPTETTRSLSPVSDLRFNDRDASERDESSTGPFGGRSGRFDKKEVRERDAFSRETYSWGGNRNGLEPKEETRASIFSDVFTPRPKEKLTPAQLERHAAFEQMLNPRPQASAPKGLFNRAPSSLDPVPAIDQPLKPPGSIPVVGKVEGRPLDPVEAYNQQQSRLRTPVFEDGIKKLTVIPGAPVPPTADSHPQSQFMRPPATHEFPSRKF